jgi:hypothetical protein
VATYKLRRSENSQNVRLMTIFEGPNLLFMSHCVFGKYAVGVPHASVLIELELPLLLVRTRRDVACATRPEPDLDERRRALHCVPVQVGKKCQALDLEEKVNKLWLAGFTHHPPPLLLNIGPHSCFGQWSAHHNRHCRWQKRCRPIRWGCY